jgi:hypothetical protein
MFNGNNSLELSSLVFWQAFRAYSAEQQPHSGVREEVTAEADYQPAPGKHTSLFGGRASGNLAASYRTSPAGAK